MSAKRDLGRFCYVWVSEDAAKRHVEGFEPPVFFAGGEGFRREFFDMPCFRR